MPHYSVATTKDKLSSLIDKALAGEEVVITRHGKPTVSLHVVQPDPKKTRTRREWRAHLEVRRRAEPPLSGEDINSVAAMREGYRY